MVISDFWPSSDADSLLIFVDQARIPMNNPRAAMGGEMPAPGDARRSYLDPGTMHM